jgi:hypothetical protein
LWQSLASLKLRLLLASWKGINSQELITFQQNRFKQEGGGNYILRSTNLLPWFGTKKNCPTSCRNQLSYLFTKRVIKLSVVIIGAYHCCQLHTNFYPTFFSLS